MSLERWVGGLSERPCVSGSQELLVQDTHRGWVQVSTVPLVLSMWEASVCRFGTEPEGWEGVNIPNKLPGSPLLLGPGPQF